MTTEPVLTHRVGDSSLCITIDRPEKRNAIDLQTAALLREHLAHAAVDDSVRCIIVTGSGVAAFSAGYDIHEMANFGSDGIIASIVARDPLLWEIANHPKVVISAMNGVAHGAGALIGAASDIRVGGPNLSFLVTATKYGSANATWTLPHIVGFAKAKEILLTGSALSATECLQLGLLNHLVAEDQVMAKAVELADAITAHPPEAAVAVKALINTAIGKSLEAQYHAEQIAMIGAPTRQRGGKIFSGFTSRSKHSVREAEN